MPTTELYALDLFLMIIVKMVSKAIPSQRSISKRQATTMDGLHLIASPWT
jgi:hypothetical protein